MITPANGECLSWLMPAYILSSRLFWNQNKRAMYQGVLYSSAMRFAFLPAFMLKV